MEKIKSDIDFIQHIDNFKNKQVIDVGCGTGNLVRWFASQNANVTGLDVEPMLSKALDHPKHSKEIYKKGVGEDLPFEDNFADYIFYIASFHHIPVEKMETGINECKRVLKPGGMAVFIEPVAEKGSYYELVKLVEDEKYIQENALRVLKNSTDEAFNLDDEKFYYFERSFENYKNLLDIFVEDSSIRENCRAKAKTILENLAKAQNINADEVLLKSIIRVIYYLKN